MLDLRYFNKGKECLSKKLKWTSHNLAVTEGEYKLLYNDVGSPHHVINNFHTIFTRGPGALMTETVNYPFSLFPTKVNGKRKPESRFRA